jgi:hypothetical protein
VSQSEAFEHSSENAISDCRNQSRSAAFRRPGVSLVYSLFTAADEKITLSVVQVNNKPQHLVFCLHFVHSGSKYRDFAVESSQTAFVERLFSSQLLHFWCKNEFRFDLIFERKPSLPRRPLQCDLMVDFVGRMWTSGQSA